MYFRLFYLVLVLLTVASYPSTMTVAVSAIDLRSRFENWVARERERNDLIDVSSDKIPKNHQNMGVQQKNPANLEYIECLEDDRRLRERD